MIDSSNLDHKTVSVIKALVMDGVGKANSGHPGGPMSSADFAYILYKEFLNYNPDDPNWFNRDRFVLSAGHESMLLYSLLTLQGFMTIDDLKNFRQFGSKTAGHPEVEVDGVEATTGPLGQGVGMAAGMAIAESMLGAMMGHDVSDHYTYVIAGDGDLQEPIALGCSQLASHYGLNKLIVFYDNNEIQISGGTSRADSTDIAKEFEAFGWNVMTINGHDHDAIRKAITTAKSSKDKPTMIIGKTIMANGVATMEGSHETHGAPLGDEEVKATKKKWGLPENETFHLPAEIVAHFTSRKEELKKKVSEWKTNLDKKLTDSAFKTKWDFIHQKTYTGFKNLPEFKEGIATRSASGKVLEALADQMINFVGGSADLEPSNDTKLFFKKTGDFTKSNRSGRNFAFGVREFPMGVLINGMALHGGFRAFGATFLVFSDYERGSLRLSALQHLPVLHIFTHDSFLLGEDGPTHQPIEHIASLRAIPNMLVIRPADGDETRSAIEIALEQKSRPTCLILTRQKVPSLGGLGNLENVRKGAYIVKGSESEKPDILIIATGSEVEMAMKAADMITGKKVRVVNMPCMELFEEQPETYKNKILPLEVTKRVTVEAGSTFGWGKYAGLEGLTYGRDSFGASAPANVLAEKFGFTAEALAKAIQAKFK